MKNTELNITNQSITFKDNPRNVVMHRASKSLMEFYSDVVCQNKGNVLDVGFGMGFSAERMSSVADHYTCIEINEQVYKRALEWASDKDNVTILLGDWADVIPTLTQKFDGIFMDTYDDLNYNKFEEYCKMISSPNCILSIFNYFSLRDTSELNSYEYALQSDKYDTVVQNHHTIHWTVFDGTSFNKAPNNKIKTHQTSII